MKRVTQFFIVDTIAFAVFVLLAATGILVRYTLPAGSGHFSTLWGMDRHEWGHIHFWMAIALMAALSLHLFFHWRWVVSMVRGQQRAGSEATKTRTRLAVVGLIGLIALAAAPFLAPVEQSGDAAPHKSRAAGEANPPDIEHAIDGTFTLQQVEEQTGVSVGELIRALDLPAETSPDERLGRLRRLHGFEMDDVRRIIAERRTDR